MGEELGGASAAQVTVNFDIASLNNKIDDLTKIFSGDEKTLIKDIAIRLYSNVNFETIGKSYYQVAQDSVNKAMGLVDVLKKQGII